MSNSKPNSGSISEKTSGAEQRKNETDQQYLQRQAETAQRAIAALGQRLQEDLLEGVDPRQWAKEYPWATVGAALVGGFAAASLLVPSKEQQALKRLEKIERVLRPEVAAENGEQKPREKGMLGGLIGRAMAALQPVVISTLTGAISSKMAQPQPEDLQAAQEGQQA